MVGETQAVSSYRDLLVWRSAMDLAVACYEATNDFPRSEVYSMTSQIRRSSSGIAANIAEGFGRETTPGFIQFLRIAQGSLKELETHLILASRVRLLSQSIADSLLSQAERIGKMLRKLIRRLQERS
jgi:four helix bundle protein